MFGERQKPPTQVFLHYILSFLSFEGFARLRIPPYIVTVYLTSLVFTLLVE